MVERKRYKDIGMNEINEKIELNILIEIGLKKI